MERLHEVDCAEWDHEIGLLIKLLLLGYLPSPPSPQSKRKKAISVVAMPRIVVNNGGERVDYKMPPAIPYATTPTTRLPRHSLCHCPKTLNSPSCPHL